MFRVLLRGACVFLAGAALFACGPAKEKQEDLPAIAASVQTIIGERHAAMLQALTAHDFPALATYVHPVLGLRNSEDAYISADDLDPVFSRSQIEHAASDTTTLVMGERDGSGEFIYSSLSVSMDTLARVRYAEADSVLFNSTTHRGNCFNNAYEAYPGSIVVEYYWAGTGDQADFNWHSTRFVYVEYEGEWFLTAVAGDHWCT